MRGEEDKRDIVIGRALTQREVGKLLARPLIQRRRAEPSRLLGAENVRRRRRRIAVDERRPAHSDLVEKRRNDDNEIEKPGGQT